MPHSGARRLSVAERANDRYAAVGKGRPPADSARGSLDIPVAAQPRRTVRGGYGYIAMRTEAAADQVRRLSEQARSVAAEVPAASYLGSRDLCIVTCFFNPCGYRSRVLNCIRFMASLEGSDGVHWRCIECAFGDSAFSLPASEHVVRVRSNSILWQKERLLNLLIRELPRSYTKIAWVDADVLFTNPEWIVDAAEVLDEVPVAQLFTHLLRADDRLQMSELGVDTIESYASVYRRYPDRALGPTYFDHGHTGLAWAGRRDWLQQFGLYDCCLSGTGDHLMAHAFVGDWDPGCLGIGEGSAYRHFVDWCESVYPSLRARLGVVPGQALSLWHGAESTRNYYGALCKINDLGFDPWTDLRANDEGCWEWSSSKLELHDWTRSYFHRRREDG